ncbi:MAG: hypothetical protein K9L78_05590 [Victivallales bacterium]|nr:hypothetical protein [Victivallales bacterium]
MEGKKSIHIVLMSLLLVGTSIGGGILGLPLQTGLAGFFPSLLCFILIGFAMTVSGWVLLLRFIKNNGSINNIAMLYHHELGPWAKHLNTISYFFTFYGLLVAYLSGAAGSLISIFPTLNEIPLIHKLITIAFFLFATSLIVFGKQLINRSNTLLSVTLIILFFILITLTLPHISTEKLGYQNWTQISSSLPILVTAFGYHIVIPVVFTLCSDKGYRKKHYFYILMTGIFLIFCLNFIWATVVMGILPVHSANSPSITSALSKGLPATVPIAKCITSGTLMFVSFVFTLFAISTSYLGVGAGLLNYNEGLVSYYLKTHKKKVTLLITFIIPLVVALIYPGIFISILGLVGGIGVILSCGLLPVFSGLKHDNPAYIKILSIMVIIICLIVFVIECRTILGY